jgi:hypothetical protein
MGAYVYRLLGPKVTLQVRLTTGEIVTAHCCVFAYKPTNGNFFGAKKPSWECSKEAALASLEKLWRGYDRPKYVVSISEEQHQQIKSARLNLDGAALRYYDQGFPSSFLDWLFDKTHVIGHFRGPGISRVFVAHATEKPSPSTQLWPPLAPTQDKKRDALLLKVHKMLTLAKDKAALPAEAANARDMALALAKQHNLRICV